MVDLLAILVLATLILILAILVLARGTTALNLTTALGYTENILGRLVALSADILNEVTSLSQGTSGEI
jgi:hypothetical protein